MKIIQTDNYDRDEVSESVVAENIQNERYAVAMRDALLALVGERSDAYFKLEHDDYKPYVFEP